MRAQIFSLKIDRKWEKCPQLTRNASVEDISEVGVKVTVGRVPSLRVGPLGHMKQTGRIERVLVAALTLNGPVGGLAHAAALIKDRIGLLATRTVHRRVLVHGAHKDDHLVRTGAFECHLTARAHISGRFELWNRSTLSNFYHWIANNNFRFCYLESWRGLKRAVDWQERIGAALCSIECFLDWDLL